MRQRIFSGIQPSGIVHIGNYLGALRHWTALQDADYDCLYCVVDLHAITIYQKPAQLRSSILETAALCLAVGIDPKRSILFVQSDVSEHAELAWILNCCTYMGELSRMTQFKDKAHGRKLNVNVGLYDYPVLMAADILLYAVDKVPIGDDQRQHLELARELARRFNKIYGDTLTVPEGIIAENGARIMGLDDPAKKMSKSASSPSNYIALTDSDGIIMDKIKTAVTDSGSEIVYNPARKPAISNLLIIYSLVSGKTLAELELKYRGQGYAVFKKELGEALCQFLGPVRKRLHQWLSQPHEIERILKDGAKRARMLAGVNLETVREKIGLGITKLT